MQATQIYECKDAGGHIMVVHRIDDGAPSAVVVSCHGEASTARVALPMAEAHRLAEALDPDVYRERGELLTEVARLRGGTFADPIRQENERLRAQLAEATARAERAEQAMAAAREEGRREGLREAAAGVRNTAKEMAGMMGDEPEQAAALEQIFDTVAVGVEALVSGAQGTKTTVDALAAAPSPEGAGPATIVWDRHDDGMKGETGSGGGVVSCPKCGAADVDNVGDGERALCCACDHEWVPFLPPHGERPADSSTPPGGPAGRDDDALLACAHGCGETPHRFRPSPEAGPHWRCSECGEITPALKVRTIGGMMDQRALIAAVEQARVPLEDAPASPTPPGGPAGLSTPEPAPRRADGPPVWDLVIADMRQRDQEGRRKYGTPLQAFNGRRPLVDAYQEVLDLAVYLRQAIEETASPPPPGGPEPAAITCPTCGATLAAGPSGVWAWPKPDPSTPPEGSEPTYGTATLHGYPEPGAWEVGRG